MNTLPPLALYVHMPWCVRKCPYCDFNSHVAPEVIPQQQYVDALIEDLALEAGASQGRALVSIFFGGGTPSLFAPDEIGRFLAAARSLVTFAPDLEVTLEANPGTVEHGRFSGYRDAGINRVSLGAQTFDPDHLRTLGRIHGSGDIARAVDEVRSAGLENFNLDLMYGLPAQTLQQALADLDAALAFQPEEFAVGVDIFGVSNWLRTLESMPKWWEAQRAALYKEIGDPQADRAFLEETSPLLHADKIRKPLFVIQGANDPRVIRGESDDIVAAVKKNGVPVEYVAFDDEGHGFTKKKNQIEGWSAILKFLDKYLRGPDKG